jgi:hypothetical protein
MVQDPVKEDQIKLFLQRRQIFNAVKPGTLSGVWLVSFEQQTRIVEDNPLRLWIMGKQPVCKNAVAAASIQQGEFPVGKVSINAAPNREPAPVVDILFVERLQLIVVELFHRDSFLD